MRIKEGKFSVYEIDPMYLEYLSKYEKSQIENIMEY